MATLREIRKKLDATRNILKITQAMEMVAASRLRKAQAKAEAARPYAEKMRLILQNLIATTEAANHPLIKAREVKKKIGIIAIAGDRGLCGGYNQAIFASTENLIKNYQKEQIRLFLFGHKTIDYFSNRKWTVDKKEANWGGKISYSQVEDFTNNLIKEFIDQQLDEIWLIYTDFINVGARKVIVEKFLPIEVPQMAEDTAISSPIIEPNAEELYADLLPSYLITKMQTALHEAYASELAARIFAMRAATKNAEEMIDSLTTERNKLRQASITRELIEIISGAESLK